MKHLNDVELVDYLDGALDASRAGHVEVCDACRGRARMLRSTLTAVRPEAGDDLPEPSPLFWEHFSRRVREALHDVEPPVRSRWFHAPLVRWASATVLVLLAFSIVMWNQAQWRGDSAPARSAEVDIESPSASPDLDMNVEDDEEWALVRVIADDLEWEDAHEAGLHARPGSAERVALEMSPAERQELARLIHADLMKDDRMKAEAKRTGA